jgi:putative tricarboxylic transport membrane protein
MHNIEPGPLVFINSADLVWVVFAAMFFANIAILVLGFVETKAVLHLLKIPFQFLATGILLMSTIGAYAVRGLAMDVFVMFAAGIMAYLLRRTGYSIAGIVLGLILGKLGEQNFAQAMQLVSYDMGTFLSRPIVAVLVFAGLATILTNMYRAFKGSHKGMEV